MRKHKLPEELANLSSAELAEVNDWLRKHPYSKVQQLMLDRFGCKPSLNKLCRHYQRLQFADEIGQPTSVPTGPSASVNDVLAIQNGEPLSDEQITNHLKLHALRMVQNPNLNVAGLSQLFQLFTYDDRRKFAEHRATIELRKHDLRERRLALKNRIANLVFAQASPSPREANL
ncbi:MAG TPA: hypothetical protein VF773_20945 [Verrucomicrobiae bacterium]